MQYPASVATTWLTSFEQLDDDDARALLNQLAFLAPEPVPRDLIPDGQEESLIQLRRLSLVRFLDDPPNSFLVHRLVQEIVRSRLADKEAGQRFGKTNRTSLRLEPFRRSGHFNLGKMDRFRGACIHNF